MSAMSRGLAAARARHNAPMTLGLARILLLVCYKRVYVQKEEVGWERWESVAQRNQNYFMFGRALLGSYMLGDFYFAFSKHEQTSMLAQLRTLTLSQTGRRRRIEVRQTAKFLQESGANQPCPLI